ncbi:MAG TPA: Flp pilus assembly protein CpaB [Candidatus Acidoferrales bacterium]|nr:Flp pilus assembly protein CpaB [Candidatus Acidoferrales bacterium]
MAVAPAQSRLRPANGRLFIVVGAVLALLAFLVVILQGGIGLRGGPSGPVVNVVVAARDIPLRAPLSKDDLSIQHFAQSDAPPQSFATEAALLGLSPVAEINIAKGQPLTQNMIARSGDLVAGTKPAYLPIPQGFVATTIKTSELQGVAGYIQPGDYINVVATVSTSTFQPTSSAPSKTVTRTVFTNVPILRAGPAGSTGQAAGVPSSLTIVMSQCDADFMQWLSLNAQLSYTLPSYHDYQPQDTKPDPACPNAQAAGLVRPADVDHRWGFTQ